MHAAGFTFGPCSSSAHIRFEYRNPAISSSMCECTESDPIWKHEAQTNKKDAETQAPQASQKEQNENKYSVGCNKNTILLNKLTKKNFYFISVD